MAETVGDVKDAALRMLDLANAAEARAREARIRADVLAEDAATLREAARALGDLLDRGDEGEDRDDG